MVFWKSPSICGYLTPRGSLTVIPNSGRPRARTLVRSLHVTTSTYIHTSSSSFAQKEGDNVPRFGKPEAYVSTSLSPLFNLSLEEHLLRTKPHNAPLCFIYRNAPCIVVGRNQNQWTELNVEEMRKRGLMLVRRRSGGGAVFHDHGNTNFSFHVPRMTFARRTHAELIARALNGRDIGLRTIDHPSPSSSSAKTSLSASEYPIGHGHPEGVYVNERNDLVVRIAVRNEPTSRTAGNAVVTQSTTASSHVSTSPSQESSPEAQVWSERKISGSAFKILTHRAYHHGTMLLSTNLGDLGFSLRNTKLTSSSVVSRGVESVRSQVVNLTQAYPDVARAGRLSHEHFWQAVVGEFRRTYDDQEEGDLGIEASESPASSGQKSLGYEYETIDETHSISRQSKRIELEAELGQWEWMFGQCPEFSLEVTLPTTSSSVHLSGHALQTLRERGGLRSVKLSLTCRHGLIQEVQVLHLDLAEHANLKVDGRDPRVFWEHLFASLKERRYDSLTERPLLAKSSSEEMVVGLEVEDTSAGCGFEETKGILAKAMRDEDEELLNAVTEWLRGSL